MSLLKIFDVASSGLRAQNVRLNTVASNMANANSVHGDPAEVYRARQPVFSAMMDSMRRDDSAVGVKTLGVSEKAGELNKRHDPGNPLANDEGYVYETNVNPIEEMADMISASRSFQNNLEVINTTKSMLLATIKLGQ